MSNTSEIIEIIREFPKVTASQIIEFCPHMRRQNVYSTLNSLNVRGIIAADLIENPNPKGKNPIKRVNGYTLEEKPNPKSYKARKGLEFKKVKVADTSAELEQLRERVLDLEQWKREALARYPDLAVDPITKRARELSIARYEEIGDFKMAAEIKAGKKDKCPFMLIAISALNEV